MNLKENYLERILALFILFFAGSVFFTLHAQYFGQNKVRYETFNFKVLKTDHFDIYFYPPERAAAEQAARMAERWYARHAQILKYELNGRQPLILYGSHPEFEETNTAQGPLGEGVGGFTEPLKRRIVLPLASSLGEIDHVVGHELVHAFQYDMTGQGGGGFRNPAALQMPLWFIEGMAEYLSLGPDDPQTAMWMRDAVLSQKKLPNIRRLEDPNYFPYRYGQALLAYIGGRWGDEKLGQLLRAAGRKGDIYEAIRQTLKIGPDTLATDWHNALHAVYDPLKTSTDTLISNATLLVGDKKGGGTYNISPVLSPDGKKFIFFSEKDLFAIDLYLADAGSGKILKKIIRNELDPHYESLEFIYSAGAWDPSSRRIALGSVVNGHPELTIIDIDKNKTDKEARFPNFGEILNPAWSPDGRYIIFSMLTEGQSDLFLYDFKADSVGRLTNDLYADLQPAWSPDGKEVVFVTDRFSTNLALLNNGRYELATLNLRDRKINPLPVLDKGNIINPQWSADGKSLYFISDVTGISNLYRMALDGRQIFRLTNVYTGISGITALSPALSVATNTDRVLFTAYLNGKYNIYALQSPEQLAGRIFQTVAADTSVVENSGNPALLPPDQRKTDEVETELHNPVEGLVADTTFNIKPYHPKLTLDYIGQPYLFAGGSSYGLQIGGGISMFWSDLLGNHNLATMLQIQSERGAFNLAGGVGYLNSKSRWDWGAAAQQIPYIWRGFASGYAVQDSNLVYVDQEEIYQQLNRELSLFAAYPFSRAKRVEFSGGFQRISFSDKLYTTIYDAYSGARLQDHTDKLPVPDALNLGTFGVAYVYDYSSFGATSPILGQRFRLEVSPVFGSINFYNVAADYRYYFMPLRPFTFSARLLHYGRYGSGAEDERLLPFFLGYQSFVRGYSSTSFSSDIPVYNRLFGSRIAVGNLELRFPLFGVLGLGHGYYGAFPLETGIFYDTGVAWTNADKVSFLGGDRKPVSSYGATFRLNLLGYLVLETDLVKPLDRPDKNWLWQFGFITGF